MCFSVFYAFTVGFSPTGASVVLGGGFFMPKTAACNKAVSLYVLIAQKHFENFGKNYL